MQIQILVDDINSWILPYTRQLEGQLRERGHSVDCIHDTAAIRTSDVLFMLGCTKIVKAAELAKSRFPLVVHESALPQGKGWSPLTWQILEGKRNIPICLIGAVERVDAGPIFLKREMHFEGHELLTELKHRQGEETVSLCLEFIDSMEKLKPIPQVGEESFYERRTPAASQLDLNKTLEEQFNLLRVCDNDRYPAYFDRNGHRYIIKVTKLRGEP